MNRWGRLGRWAIVGAAAALTGGCGLLVGFPDRTLAPDESSGGASASSSSGMGGNGSSASSGGDGGAPTTVTSSGSASSSASSSTSTGGAPTYCDTLSPKPLFCDDFEGGSLTTNWTVEEPANSTVATSTQQSEPPSGHSLEVGIKGGPGENVGLVSRPFQGMSYTSARLVFSMYIDEYPSTDLSYVAELGINSDLGALIYFSKPGRLKVQQRYNTNNFGADLDSGTDVPLHTWTRVDLTLTLSQGSSTATLKLGPTEVLKDAPLVSQWGPGKATLRLGNVIIKNEEPRAVYYDNVVFDAY